MTEELVKKAPMIRIKDIIKQPKDSIVEGVLFISSCEVKMTKTNKPYTDLKLTDGQGSIEAKIWSTSLEIANGFNALDFTAKLGEFNGTPQLTINKYKMVYRELDEAVSSVNVEDTIRQLKVIVNNMEDKELKELIQVMVIDDIDNPDNLFRTAPAATHNHHNYRNGLLRHTLEVTRIAYNIARAYSNYINMDLVVAGAILHDIGKVKVYLINDFEVSRDEYQGLQEHLYIGTQMVMEHKEIFKDNPEKLDLLINIIGSHHGNLEWGALFKPATQEAIIVHLADMASSQLEALEKAAVESPEELLKTSYSGMFKHQLSPKRVREIMRGEITIGDKEK